MFTASGSLYTVVEYIADSAVFLHFKHLNVVQVQIVDVPSGVITNISKMFWNTFQSEVVDNITSMV